MCRSTSPSSSASETRSAASSLLLSLKTYDGYGGPPPLRSMVVTCLFFVAVLATSEHLCRIILEGIKTWHPLLEIELNRQILARHVGVDAFSCFGVTVLGWRCRELLSDIIDFARGKKISPAYEPRLFTYHPAAARIGVIFFAYQIKNTYDTIVWGDGIEFFMHHILCMGTAWGVLKGCAHSYVPFYFGVSEASTAVLTLLANFDDEFGVKGLGEAFPLTKILLGGTFTVLFLVCRVFCWSTVSYVYCRDVFKALQGTDPRKDDNKLWLQFTFVSLGLLSLLQILWLGQIVITGKEELEKMGML